LSPVGSWLPSPGRGEHLVFDGLTYTNSPRILKVFVASPNDVIEERIALAKLIGDINDVLVYLAPEKQLRLELVPYETHAYPDLGRPQDVINREIPIDYDIFVGIMCKRVGRPTDTADSGTVEEFSRACQRREKSLHPLSASFRSCLRLFAARTSCIGDRHSCLTSTQP
jgi:hypothetical protein